MDVAARVIHAAANSIIQLPARVIQLPARVSGLPARVIQLPARAEDVGSTWIHVDCFSYSVYAWR